MPDLRQVSGKPLPSPEVPAGTVTVRVIRGSFANNLVGQTVEVTVDGETDDDDRRERPRGDFWTSCRHTPQSRDRRRAAERLESEEITVGSGGLRVMLVAADPEDAKRAAESQKARARARREGAGCVRARVPDRVAEMAQDRLTICTTCSTSARHWRDRQSISEDRSFWIFRVRRGARYSSGDSPEARDREWRSRVTVLGPFTVARATS